MNILDLKSRWLVRVCAAVSCGFLGAAALYFLRKKSRKLDLMDAPSASRAEQRMMLPMNVDEVSTEKVQEILQEVAKSHEQIRRASKEMTKQLVQVPLSFEETYNLAKEATQPMDPLERYGLSIEDLDKLLDKHQYDPSVAELVRKIMRTPDVSGNQKNVSVDALVEVHAFMVELMENLTNYFLSKPDRGLYDMKIVVIAVQWMVGAAVETKFNITSEDLEGSMSANFDVVGKNEHLQELTQKLGKTMNELMESSNMLPTGRNLSEEH